MCSIPTIWVRRQCSVLCSKVRPVGGEYVSTPGGNLWSRRAQFMSVSSAFDGTNIQGVTTRHRGVGPGGAADRRSIGQGGLAQSGSSHGNVYPLNARRRGSAPSRAQQGAAAAVSGGRTKQPPLRL